MESDRKVALSVVIWTAIFAVAIPTLVYLLGRNVQETRNVPANNFDFFYNVYFKYRPLDPTKREIRLLHLPKKTRKQWLMTSSASVALIRQGEDPDEMYCCILEHVSLDDAPPYQALSYTWGDAEPTCMIMVNDQPFWITSNLAEAIHHLTEKQGLDIWIDAICINQKDDVEKSWQVQQMRQVYEHAESVIVWLGRAVVGSRQTLNKLVALEQAISVLAKEAHLLSPSRIKEAAVLRQLERTLFGLSERSESQYPAESSMGAAIDGGRHDPPTDLRVMSGLLGRPWWGRIWVVQELAVAKHISFACGYDMIPGTGFKHFLEHWDSIMMGVIPMLLGHRPWALFEVREQLRLGDPLSMKDLLQISSKSQLEASDPRDQIFGLFSLAKDANALGLRVDYGQSRDSLYIDVAKYLLDENNLWMFSFCHFRPLTEHSLPSWVPDWSGQSGLISLLQAGCGANTREPSPFRASEGSKPFISFIDQESPRLAVSGIQVDRVTSIGSTRPLASQNNMDENTRLSILSWARTEFRELARAESIYGTEKQRKEAVWRTLIANQWLDPRFGWMPATSSVENAYDRLLGSQGSADRDVDSDQFFANMMNITNGRRPFCTNKGYLGIGSPYVSEGDIVVVLFGADVPHVLRPSGHMRYRLIGEAYVYGIMYGEFLRDGKGDTQSTTFELE